MDWKTWLAPSVTVAVALLGFAAKYFNDIKIAQRKDRLDRINQQLKLLYGPLYAIDQAGNTAWTAFRERNRPNKSYWTGTPPPNEQDKETWRLWMREVFMPLNLRLEKTIVENADLLIEKKMPESLLLLLAHVSAYKAVLKRWENQDYTEHISLVNFPRQEVRTYAEKSFTDLKNEQARLLGLLSGKRGLKNN